MRDRLLEDFGQDYPEAVSTTRLEPVEWYRLNSLKQGFLADPAQENAVRHLQRLYDELLDFKAYRNRRLARAFGKRPPPRGLYLWGGVGRGKSFLMDAFYINLPYKRKRRVHFHHFMQTVHRALKKLDGESDPLAIVAKRVSVGYRVVCFDEFHVSDIVDAMILGRILQGLFDNGVVLVVTSNYRPDDLYPNGLQRDRFLPAIKLINERLDIINVDGGIDYRLRKLDKIEVYHSPLDSAAQENLEKAFEQAGVTPEPGDTFVLQQRRIKVIKRAPGIVWFDFATLCGGPRGQADYLELAREFHTVIVSEVPKMTPQMASEARRFTWMVDIFYDHKVKLILSAEVPPEELYVAGEHRNEFARTVSRLQEMQSREYLGLAHIS
jgi:cell division protein ZapE